MCKIGWTDQEDRELINLKEQKSMESWSEICYTINKNNIGKNRTGKQCRERYINYLKNQVKTDGWSNQEEQCLFKFYKIYGSCWTRIAQKLVDRSQNFIKNKFYGSIRKVLRLINKVGKQRIKKRSKPIKYESLLRIIYIAEGGQNQIQMQGQQLRDILFFLILNQNSQPQNEQKIIQLVKKIHKFNMKTRCYSLKKKKIFNKNRDSENQQDLEYEQQDQIFQELNQQESNKINQKTLKKKAAFRQPYKFISDQKILNKLQQNQIDDDKFRLPPLQPIKNKQFIDLNQDLMKIIGENY